MASESVAGPAPAAVAAAEARGPRSWPGLDPGFNRSVRAVAETEVGRVFREELAQELAGLRGTRSPIGLPMLVRGELGPELRRFAHAYHRVIERLTQAWAGNNELRRTIHLPPELARIADLSVGLDASRIHLARLDLLTQRDGGYRVVETNANCPGALLTCGVAARRWRAALASHGISAPSSLAYEHPEWMARWLMQAAEKETGVVPDLFVLLRAEGGNRLELPGLASQLRRLGIEAFEADPREISVPSKGALTLGGRPILHGYWKVGVPEFLAMRPQIDPLVRALQDGRLFLQNHFAGRFIADNKLCLAALADSRFDALFDPADLEIVRTHLPWSRNLSLCTDDEIRRVRSRRRDYVLKRPLDTRGRGVVVGREVATCSSWNAAVSRAVQEHWLVQRFCETTLIDGDEPGSPPRIHDLSLGLTNGELSGAVVRSSLELRTNVALSGWVHPVFFG